MTDFVAATSFDEWPFPVPAPLVYQDVRSPPPAQTKQWSPPNMSMVSEKKCDGFASLSRTKACEARFTSDPTRYSTFTRAAFKFGK